MTSTASTPAGGTAGRHAAALLAGAERSALARAAELAALGAGTALPNPVVGCVLLDPAGNTIGEGFHERPGGPHAEVVALAAAGSKANGATAVVTLEPCNHTGRTGPCSAALIDAGVRRVVMGARDPWPPAAGGADRLRAAGVGVVDLTGTLDAAGSLDVNRVWLTATRLQRPYVSWKAAVTVDGRVAAVDGTSRWISSEASRADTHLLRARVDTMMVGVGTVLGDNPHLTVRDVTGTVIGPQPLRVVVDTHSRTPSAAKVLDSAAETLVATAAEFGTGPDGRVDLAALLHALYQRGRRHVLLEGGPRLAASAFDRGLVDEAIVYVAPVVLGAGRTALEGGAVGTLTDAHRLELVEVARSGPDVKLRYRVTAPS